VTGTVVYISLVGADPATGCAPRTWRHHDFCIDLQTGNVEIAGTRMPPQEERFAGKGRD
jgi:hypothetical protein